MKEYVVVHVHPADTSPSVAEHPNGDRVIDFADRAALYCPGEVRILVVDDDEAVCRMIQTALASSAYRVDTVSEPSLIEETLRSTTYHLIVLDLVLPGLNSEQMWNWLRESQTDASIIVITGYPSLDSALSCLRARTYDYLTKPFQVAHLQHIVQRCLESRGLLRLSEEALRESLGKSIRERRKSLGLTLAQMAQRTGVSLGYLSQIELGKNSASIETLYRISLGLGMKISELFQSVQNA
jgi:CheY-like chemotaxis protein/DNA-binding XRE family transcriptional regulator